MRIIKEKKGDIHDSVLELLNKLREVIDLLEEKGYKSNIVKSVYNTIAKLLAIPLDNRNINESNGDKYKYIFNAEDIMFELPNYVDPKIIKESIFSHLYINFGANIDSVNKDEFSVTYRGSNDINETLLKLADKHGYIVEAVLNKPINTTVDRNT